MVHEYVMDKAIKQAQDTMRQGLGGPFGAAIIDPKGVVVCVTSNTVLGDHDPTAHAEINAIREACKILGTHDLTGYTLYATGYPCPMCLSAIIWANIKKVYYGCTVEDADNIGFRDDFIYDFIESHELGASILQLEQVSRDSCIKLFNEYSESNMQMY